MFKIYDGRSEFYQWDLNCKLIVEDKSMTEVHFCNRTGECSLVRDVYEVNGMYLADVPNILLQDNWDIKVYGFTANHTKHSTVYNVVPRTKPDTYVYTETEMLKWEQLEERIDQIEENGVSDEVVANAVEGYMTQNNVLAGYATETYVQEQIDKIPEPDFTGYATEKYVDEAVAAIDIPEVDFTGYATEQYVIDAINGMDIPDNALLLESYVTDTAVGAEVQSIWANGITRPVFYEKKPVIGYKAASAGATRELILYVLTDNKTVTMHSATFSTNSKTMVFNGHVNVTMATEDFVSTKIAEAQLGGSDVDLSGYYTKTETDTAISTAIGKIEHPTVDLSEYAKKSEIPSTAGLATESYVQDEISKIEHPVTDLSDYYNKAEVDAKIEAIEIPDSPGGTGDAVEEIYVGTDIPEGNYKLWINPDESEEFATVSYVDSLFNSIVNGDEVSY